MQVGPGSNFTAVNNRNARDCAEVAEYAQAAGNHIEFFRAGLTIGSPWIECDVLGVFDQNAVAIFHAQREGSKRVGPHQFSDFRTNGISTSHKTSKKPRLRD